MQIRAPTARSAAPPTPASGKGGSDVFVDVEPWRGPFGLSGELGPRAPGLDFEARARPAPNVYRQ
eukprot:5779431-Alexandrium_andersonii.AAC.1